MSRKVIMLSLIFAMGIAIGLNVSQVLNAQQQAVKSTVLQKTALVGMEGKEGVIVLTELAAGGLAKKHYHPGHHFSYILEGSIIMEVEGKQAVTYKAGDTFYLSPKEVHFASNASTTAPVKVLGFSVEDKGQPLAVPVK